MASTTCTNVCAVLGESCQYFAVFGGAVLIYVSLNTLKSLLSGIRNFFLSSMPDFTKYGSWAVVTGATDGIGKAYAQILAENGMNIVLISRSPEKLAKCADEIESQFGVQTRTIAADFSEGFSTYDDISLQLSDLDVGVLINNVGMMTPLYTHFHTSTSDFMDKLIKVNVLSTTLMTEIVLPRMLVKRTGFVANISSVTGLYPVPTMALYSASKAYMNFFSNALRVEYANRGIVVQCVTPLAVATNMTPEHVKGRSWLAPYPRDYVRSALATAESQANTFGCLAHAVQGYIISLLPINLIFRISAFVYVRVRRFNSD